MSRCAAFVFLASASLASTALADSSTNLSDEHPTTATTTSAIVGGTDVPSGRWPDTVAVLGESGVCSGTLIAPDVVLTAGHCADINPKYVVANTTDYANPGGSKVGVAKTVAHPDWENTYDVSVIVLGTPINSVTPRRIGTSCSFSSFAPNTMVHLVGFGVTDAEGATSNTHLKEATTAVTDPSCSEGNGCNPTVAPGGEFVAGGSGSADSCFGDSGGPVYLDTPRGPVVIGAVSRGVSNSDTPCGGGGIYVRTDAIVDWIEEASGRTIAKDSCDADTYSADPNAEIADPAQDSAGCSASGRSGSSTLAVLGLATLALIRRRRRNA